MARLSKYRVLETSDADVAVAGIQERHPGLDRLNPIAKDFSIRSNAFLMGSTSLIYSQTSGYTIETNHDSRIRIAFPLTGSRSLKTATRNTVDLSRAEAFLVNYGGSRLTFGENSSSVLLMADNDTVAAHLRLLDCEIDPAVIAERLTGHPSAAGLPEIRRSVMNTI